MDFIDLHIHTTASDGTDTPREVVEKAKALGLAAIAITDHDTLAGVEEAMTAGQELGVEVIPGVELSVDYYGRDLHLLGYFTDGNAAPLREMLDSAAAERERRNEKIVAALAEAGYPVSMEELREDNPGHLLGRPHIADLLVKKGAAASRNEAFEKFLGEGKPFYIPRKNISMATAAAVLRESGAVSSLAHPLKYGYEGMQVGALMQNVRCCGIEHVEAFYGDYTEDQIWELRDLAKEWGMDVTGGSDYHGARRGMQLGTGGGELRVPDWILEDLKAYREEM